eukprot:CAMPEP_0170541992 /NCGR_PEP_ID=MMETSP0211-20121228/1563_1 /TAXON_ID=311385 /ORGANISM="Pseudokeronopsis sp., Strain OXSARD2" /LENGTH=134 /DNA_ID=CAMNT_0010844917 /DNA_START=40 /DNA_END=444 /DNA_ORIENTATION=+
MCHQQDFLPFQCDACNKIFCGNHRRQEDHNCTIALDYDSNYVIICPICSDRLKMKGTDNADTLWNSHMSSGQCKPGQKKPTVSDPELSNKKCQAEKCYTKLNSINYFKCPGCLKEVCMTHRYEDKHQCTKILSR